MDGLDPAAFKPRKDQRMAVNRWNRFVLGQSYIRAAARLCPKTRQYVLAQMSYCSPSLLFFIQRTGLTMTREKKHRKTHFDVLTQIHETEYANVKKPIDPKTKKPIEPAHRFEVNIESDSFSQAKYDVFLKYQTTIHHDPVSRWGVPSFKRFLCSGINRKTVRDGSKEQKLGSYHQCYRLDGKLIAVAVLDLLPHGVSSVYLFYDPDFGDFEFGKISALREIALTIEGDYKHYYMGFYIHSCQKMRYKANFEPQYILDPESLTWDLLDDDFKKKLDKHPYVSLSSERASAAAKAVGGDVEMQDTTANDEEKESPDGKMETDPLANEEEMSLFDVHMPGVMTLKELEEQVDLDHWQLLAHGVLVEMIDLVPWDDADIHNPQSIKGIIAELAATLGPKVVENSAVVLF
ncbi:Arginyl-tRNA--protein transferase 1 [Onygenales sp. PD_10]|nr:Arginyl-tRNA--protein transferase 1 [Onygenales sp. PD_10]